MIEDIPAKCCTLIELLRFRATQQPDGRAYTFLADGESENARLTYGQLDRQARVVAAHIQANDAAGERAVLLYPPGLDYIVALFGCLYAGVVAVPAYPPRPNRSRSRLQSIMEDAQPKRYRLDRENPLGWSDVGKSGTKDECLAYIAEVWTDMRPLSLRKQMEAETQVEESQKDRPGGEK